MIGAFSKNSMSTECSLQSSLLGCDRGSNKKERKMKQERMRSATVNEQ